MDADSPTWLKEQIVSLKETIRWRWVEMPGTREERTALRHEIDGLNEQLEALRLRLDKANAQGS